MKLHVGKIFLSKNKLALFTAFFFYLCLHFIQYFFIFPLESMIGSDVTWLASLVFLPHMVRVLSAWMLGPAAFFALLPADVIVHATIYSDRHVSGLEYLAPVVSSGCAIIAFELFKLAGLNLYLSATKTTNWRLLILIGAVASVFNSINASILYSGLVIPEEGIALLLNFLIGDLVGLVIGLILLVLCTRLLRLRV